MYLPKVDEVSRTQFLEDTIRWIGDALEVGASINDSRLITNHEGAEVVLFNDLVVSMNRLFNFDAMVFLLVDEADNDFVINTCRPANSRDYMDLEVNYHIENGNFSWAINQPKACITRRREGRGSAVLQVLSTRSRVRGMFIGLLKSDMTEIRDLSMNYLSMLLLNVSNSLESQALYRYVNEHNRDLEKIVSNRTSDLEAARKQAEIANLAKSNFLANMSHEIRTPLTSVIGYAEWLKDDAIPEHERHEAVTAILRTGKHVLDVINDILDLSKIESDKLHVEIMMVPLGTLMHEIERLMSMHATEKALSFNLEYSFPLPRWIMTDPTRLKQIMINLCSNAIKFTEEGSVRLNVSCRPEDGTIIFAVIDTGIGIQADKIDTLFDSFTQADASTTRRFGGSGLGLNISRRLTQMLGGDIAVASKFGEGSSFVATVTTDACSFNDMVDDIQDLKIALSQDVEGPAAEEHALQGKVLLAEDNLDNQRLIGHYMGRLGLDLTIVENGQMAVERVLEESFDLVLMDMQMPVMDGPEATEILRQAGCVVPIVALTANVGLDDRDRCLTAGCNDFLSKPIDRRHFYSVISRFLEKAGTMVKPDDALARGDLQQKYIVLLAERLQEVRQAYDNNDRMRIKSLMHQFKGSAGGYGFAALGRIAADVEAALKANIDADISAGLADFMRECRKIIA